MCCGCRVLPPPLEKISANRQNRTTHKPPAQPCPSPQCRLHHTCRTLQRLHLILQCPMACPALATHTLARLCALWLPSAASSSGNLHKQANPQPPKTTCPAQPQPPLEARKHLLHTADPATAFDPAVPHEMARAGRSHTDGTLCAVVAEYCLLLWKSPHTSKTATPTNHLPGPVVAPSSSPTTPAAHCRGCI